MEIEVIATGSSGNCFLFDKKLMIDCGLPYSRMSGVDFSKVTHVLLTHIHGDHFNTSSIRKIHQEHEHIIFVCGVWLKDNLRQAFANKTDRIKIVECGKIYKAGDFIISPVKLFHNVENCGYRLQIGNYKHFHATDTNTLDGIQALNYNSVTIECNYDAQILKIIMIQAEKKGKFTHFKEATKNHLSVQKALKFVKTNKIKKLIPVHIGNSTRKNVLEKIEKAIKQKN